LPRKTPVRGHLIALEGTRGRDLAHAAERLWQHLGGGKVRGGVSRWDASGTFHEMRLAKAERLNLSPRTLVLLYASDLAFRLRWEIRLALEEGQCVIAAPYVESAMAFGSAAGLPRRWLTEVFRFAPRPQVCYRVKEREKGSAGNGKSSDGYLEFCGKALRGSFSPWNPVDLRRKAIAYLDTLERRNGCRTLTVKLVKQLTLEQ